MAEPIGQIQPIKRILYLVDVTFFLTWTALLCIYGRHGLRFYSGMAFAGAAFVCWMTARRQLGRSFSVTAKARELVTTGLYSKFRNPIYLFSTLAYFGLAIAWGNPGGFVFVLCSIPMQMVRSRKESMVLEQAFGQQYQEYKKRTLL